MRCSVALEDGLKSPAGTALTGPRQFRFETGGPFVTRVMPRGGEIEENQILVLPLNGPPTAPYARPNIWCEPNRPGHRVPVKTVHTDPATLLRKALRPRKVSR